jgi:hypothetical protein
VAGESYRRPFQGVGKVNLIAILTELNVERRRSTSEIEFFERLVQQLGHRAHLIGENGACVVKLLIQRSRRYGGKINPNN